MKIKKSNIFLIVALSLIIIVGILLWIFLEIGVKQNSVSENINLQENKGEASLIIDNGDGKPENFKLSIKDKYTAFDALNDAAQKTGKVIKIKKYDIGVFIEAIGGKENEKNGKNWLYYVNGVMPQVAADKYELKNGDSIEFKFEKFSF